MGGTEDTKDVSTSKILRMYQPAGVVPQETIDGSTLGRKGYIIGFFNLNLFKGMCVCVCVCVCVCGSRLRNFSLVDLLHSVLVLLVQGKQDVLVVQFSFLDFLLFSAGLFDSSPTAFLFLNQSCTLIRKWTIF